MEHNLGTWFVETENGIEFIFERVKGEHKTCCLYSFCQGSDVLMGYSFVCHDKDIKVLREATDEEIQTLNNEITRWMEE